MKPMTATEVLARQKAHDEYWTPRLQRAAERIAEVVLEPMTKVIKDLKLGEKK